MAVEGVKSVEIPRVSGLSPEQFHRLEKEIFRNNRLGPLNSGWLFSLIREFFSKAKPVIITDAAEDWPCRQWTIEVILSSKEWLQHNTVWGGGYTKPTQDLAERVGDNEVMVRGKTNQEDYRLTQNHYLWHYLHLHRVGKAYTIRRDTFGSYCKVTSSSVHCFSSSPLFYLILGLASW